MSRLVMIPRDRNLWLTPQDLINRNLALPGSISTVMYQYSDPWRGEMEAQCLQFQLADSFTHTPGIQDVSFYDNVGQWDVSWLERATGRIVNEQQLEVVRYVLHKHAGAFVMRFFELPLETASMTTELLS